MTALPNWIEVIEVRSPQGTADAVERLLQELIIANGHDRVNVYRRVTLDGDFLLQLHHSGCPVESRGSDLGVRIASALRQRGLVNHTVWRDEHGGD